MPGKHRAMIGAGGIARSWLGRFLAPFAGRLEIAALVDVNREVLDTAADGLGIPAAARFTATRDAFAAVPRLGVECCIIAIPPASHEAAALGAMEAGPGRDLPARDSAYAPDQRRSTGRANLRHGSDRGRMRRPLHDANDVSILIRSQGGCDGPRHCCHQSVYAALTIRKSIR